jgi:peptide chain release factor 3
VIYDRLRKQVHLYEKTAGGAYKPPVSIHALADPLVRSALEEDTYKQVLEELDILEHAHGGFDAKAVLAGETTPVYFGSASNNFGIQALLDGYVQFSSPPVPRRSTRALVPVESPVFSAYVFKIQTNMNPLHRDRIAFMRVCSGVFKRDMAAYNTRTGAKIRLSDSHTHFGREREITNEAHPGDIIGLVSKSDLRIGDTLSEDPSIVYDEVPRFSPECFAAISNQTPSQYKSFRKGIDHLLSENIVQSFRLRDGLQSPLPLLGAVGALQFEVLQYRLKNEYGADCAFTPMPWKFLRWIATDLDEPGVKKILPYDSSLAEDESGRPVILFASEWSLERMQKEHSDKLRLLVSPKRLESA